MKENIDKWLRRRRRIRPSNVPPPFTSAHEIGDVQDHFHGYDIASDEYLQPNTSLPGRCYICQQNVLFEVDPPGEDGTINWRETLRCPGCHLISRWRGCLHVFDAVCQPREQDRIYLTETLSPVFDHLEKLYPNLIGSEFLPQAELGHMVQLHPARVRNEDVTRLTFEENSFDAILCFDVMEHIPDYREALREFYRVLDLGGQLVLTAPFSFQHETVVRAVINESGEIEHRVEPCYHGDPLSSEGVLCYHDFGMEFLQELTGAGFQESFVVCYQSNEWGYPAANLAFVARKLKR